MPLTDYLTADFLETYEVHNYRHAAEVLATSCPDEFAELISALNQFRLTTADILAKGGNESQIPKICPRCFAPWAGLRLAFMATLSLPSKPTPTMER